MPCIHKVDGQAARQKRLARVRKRMAQPANDERLQKAGQDDQGCDFWL
jgi:hypothetical protein